MSKDTASNFILFFLVIHFISLILALATFKDGYITDAIGCLIVSVLCLFHAIVVSLYFLVNNS